MVTWAVRRTRTLIITIIGFTVLGGGIAMIVLPGPAIVVIPVGLAILSTEFDWAKRLLTRVKTSIVRMRERLASGSRIQSRRAV